MKKVWVAVGVFAIPSRDILFAAGQHISIKVENGNFPVVG